MHTAVPTADPTPSGAGQSLPPDLPPAVLARVRGAVLELRQDPRRACFATRLHVGAADRTVSRDVPEPADLGLRTDLLTAVLGRLGTQAPLGVRDDVPVLACWLSRPGGLDAHDADFDWALAARQAAAALELRVEFFVVTRRGWRHPGSGATRRWTRLRGAPAQSQV